MTRPPTYARFARPLPEHPGSDSSRRLFFGIPLDEDARRVVVDVVERVRRDERAAAPDDREVRWVRLEGLHVTLRFLGPTPESMIAGLMATADAAAKGIPPFDIRIHGAGAFPSPSRPRALWLGIDEGAAELAGLARRVEDRLVADGWPRDERPFRAHLTLARSDGVNSGARTVARLIAAAADLDVRWRAERLILFESRLGGGPARYDAVHEARLTA
ncbi:MAG TPA: RNA 2',3'-cyclic phosphodiesterase [Candidatus Limnocylindrales bacterium]